MSEPLTVEVEGRTWHLFPCSYDTADGNFAFRIYALSLEHAAAMLEELKATAKLDGGPIAKIIPCEPK